MIFRGADEKYLVKTQQTAKIYVVLFQPDKR